MKMNSFTKLLCIALIGALTLGLWGCAQAPAQNGAITLEEGKTYGQGENQFSLTVTGSDGKDIAVTIRTGKTIVGEALQELGIIAGEEGPYGLYIKTVNGETLDYDIHKMYWSFYVNGEYAMAGIDQTAIDSSAAYALKAEKG